MSEHASRPKTDPPSRRGFLTGAIGGAVASHSVLTPAVGAEPTKSGTPVNPRLFTFVGGKKGGWWVVSTKAIVGEALPAVERVDIVTGAVTAVLGDGAWLLRGVTSNARYVTRDEKESLVKKQAALGRTTATHSAIIPIRKSAKWWDLTQDDRRAIFEEKSKHTAVGLKYLPKIARRLHHCRDLSEAEPFDFVTLFDYAKEDVAAFDEMLATMRASEEWKFVDREMDIRLVRVD